jgi:hypothetical protein
VNTSSELIIYAGIVLFALITGIILYAGISKRLIRSFTTYDLVTISLFITLLYITILPFKLGFSKFPFIHSFFFSIPYSAILIIGIRLVPKPGATTLLILGNTIFAQILSRGINPLWWPYAILPSFALELYFILTRNYVGTLLNALGAGVLRGVVVYLYFYLFAGPFIWHKHYAGWYITFQVVQGVIASAIGAWIGFKLSKIIEKAYVYGRV